VLRQPRVMHISARTLRAHLCSLLVALTPASAVAAGSLGMSYVDTPDARLIFYDQLAYIVPRAAGVFTNALAWQRRMLGWVPDGATTFLLRDFADYGNGVAIPAPRNLILLDIEPVSHAFETFAANESLYTLTNHEVVHLVQGDMAAEQDRRWRRFFHGKIWPDADHPESLLYTYLTNPRFVAPRWYVEGGAVFFETWEGGGLGRAQGGYDEMVFRAMVRDGARFYDPLGLVSRGVVVDFQVAANAYLYGTRFITWLAYTYSPEKVLDWVRRDDASERYYADRFKQVFGVDLDDAWGRWTAFEHAFQVANLAEVRKFPVTPYRQLSARGVGSVSRTYYDEATGMLYGAFRSAGVLEFVGAMDTRDGTIRRLADVKRGMLFRVSSLALDPGSQTLFFTNDNYGPASFRDLMALDLRTGEVRSLMENARVGEIVMNPVDRTLWGVRHDQGQAALVRIPYPYTTWYGVYRFAWGYVPSDLDVSPDGKRLSASMSEPNGDQYVRVWDIDKLVAGDIAPLSEFRFGQSVPESFTFSRDGRYLYGSSYYTGVSNIFRYEVATGKVDAVSNAEIGFFRPVPLADGRLLVLAYTSEGFVPATIEPNVLEDVSAIRFLGAELAEKHPVVKTWQVPSAPGVDFDKLVVAKGTWEPLEQISLANAYPVLQGYKDSIGVGYRFNVEDPLVFAKLAITASYTPDHALPSDERGHVDITGSYLGWRAAFSWNHSEFYDLFGPVKRSRKGYAAKLGYDKGLIFDFPRKLDAKFDVAYYDKIERLPDAQNVSTPFTRMTIAQAGLHYTDLWRAPGAFDDEKGVTWSLSYRGYQVNGRHTPKALATLDYGIALPLRQSSLWLRTAVGAADASREPTVANFYFGSFRNNYVDNRPARRYRDYDTMPGFGIDEIGAVRFGKLLAEWDLPNVVFANVGTPVLHLSTLQSSLFAGGLWTATAEPSQHTDYASLGAQADLRFGFMHWYNLTLSFGYAVGYRESRRAGDEWMVSLKIM
jgi:hypothetical protein